MFLFEKTGLDGILKLYEELKHSHNFYDTVGIRRFIYPGEFAITDITMQVSS